jgi:hypothetical protein
MKIRNSKKLFSVHVKQIKIEIHPKMIMIRTYENMAHFKPFKSSSLFLVNFFLAIFCTYDLFVLTYHIFNPYNISQIKFIHKNACI